MPDVPSSDRSRLLDLAAALAVVAVTAWGAWLRVQCLAHAYEPDEISTLYHGATVLALATDPEVAVNPPLYRILFNVVFPETVGMPLARWVSVIASTLTAPLVGLATFRTTGSRLAGLGAASLVACHPVAVLLGARYRAYALWGLTLAGLMVAIEAWSRGPTRRRTLAVVGLAFLVPQWNYLGAPILLLMAAGAWWQPGLRGLWRLFVPAAIGLLPFLPALLVGGDTRVAHSRSFIETVARAFAFEVSLDRGHLGLVNQLLPGWLPSSVPEFVGAWPTVGVLVLALWGSRKGAGMIWLVTAVGTFAVLLAASQVQYVRSAVAAVTIVVAAPAVAGAFARVRPQALRGLLTVIGVVAVGASFPRGAVQVTKNSVYRDLPQFLERVHDYDDQRAGRPITVWPTWSLGGVQFYLTGTHIRAREHEVPPPCPLFCFEEQGIVWMTLPEHGTHVAPPGLVVAFRRPPEGFASQCELLDQRDQTWVWNCPDPAPAVQPSPEGP